MEAIPEEIMYIKPFILRSEEMKVADPIISYYILRYALQTGLEYHKQNSSNEKVKQYLLSMMGLMETKKKELGEVPEPQSHYEKFITLLFVSADNDDRKVGATKATAQKFLILSYFIEAMNVFEELPPDWEEKRKYCKWKAADILKALKRGEKPIPGGPNERNLPQSLGEETKNAQYVPPDTKFELPDVPPPITEKKIDDQYFYSPPPLPEKKNDDQYSYIPPPLPEKKIPVIEKPKIPPPPIEKVENKRPERPAANRNVQTKEQRAIVEQAKKFAQNGIQELEYKNIQQARIAFEKAIKALEDYNN
jgi:Vta1 like